jgi:hypothetical protein
MTTGHDQAESSVTFAGIPNFLSGALTKAGMLSAKR